MDINWINKFSVSKFITLLVGIAVTIGGFIFTTSMFSKVVNDDTNAILLAYLGIFIIVIGIIIIVQAIVMKDKWFEVNGHMVRVYVGLISFIVKIDDKVEKKTVIISFSSHDVTCKVDDLEVLLHVNAWNGTTIMVNGEKIY